MYKAFVNYDALENPEALNELKTRLGSEISLLPTNQPWYKIVCSEPFLYYRNAYIRFDHELDIIKFLYNNKTIPRVQTVDKEVVGVNSHANGTYSYHLQSGIYYFEPSIDPLPIMMGIHRRPLYFQLTLNSLLYNLRSSRQKLYIVLSDSDDATINIVKKAQKESSVLIEAVLTKNIHYGFLNFGAKFFNVSKLICFEEDVIIPESLNYYLPFWTSQFNYRSTTADLVSLKVSRDNYTPDTLRWIRNDVIKIPDEDKWYYSKAVTNKFLPVGGGMGMVIDSSKLLKNFKAPEYGTSDSIFCKSSKSICIANVPIYHIGVNEKMDYPQYYINKRNTKISLDQLQTGTDLRTGMTKVIDMKPAWSEYQSI